MIPLSGMTEPAWCDKHGVEYYGPACPECESEAEDYWEDIETRAYGTYDL